MTDLWKPKGSLCHSCNGSNRGSRAEMNAALGINWLLTTPQHRRPEDLETMGSTLGRWPKCQGWPNPIGTQKKKSTSCPPTGFLQPRPGDHFTPPDLQPPTRGVDDLPNMVAPPRPSHGALVGGPPLKGVGLTEFLLCTPEWPRTSIFSHIIHRLCP